MESTDVQNKPEVFENRPFRNNDMYQLNKCTLCPFKTHVKSSFQRHLMKQHGVKLKGLEVGTVGEFATLGRVVNDYNIQLKYAPREKFGHKCSRCHEVLPSMRKLIFHKEACSKRAKAIRNNEPLFNCQKCGFGFTKIRSLNRHKSMCGAVKNIFCQICSFKCHTIQMMQRHFIDKHNLICRPVDEPDFEQALNSTPYTLERAVELEMLPEVDELPQKELSGVNIRLAKRNNKREKIPLICPRCKLEFLKERRLNKHLKYDRCELKE